MIEDPKTGLKIMTKEEYDEKLAYWFNLGVKRGKFEKKMDEEKTVNEYSRIL